MELDEPAVIVQMVAEGLGWSIVPGALLALQSLSAIQCASLPGSQVVRKVGLLARKSVIERAVTGLLVRSLEEEARVRHSDAPDVPLAPDGAVKEAQHRRPRINRSTQP